MSSLPRRLGAVIAGAFLLYMTLPILAPVIFSFSTVWQGILPEGFTIDTYRNVLGTRKFTSALLLSFQVAGLVVAIALSLAVTSAWGIYMSRGPLGRSLRILLQVFPMVAGPLILAVGYLLTYNQPPIDISGTLWIIVAGHVSLGFPFVFRAVLSEMESRDLRGLAEAGAICGAGPIAIWTRIILPNLAGSIISGSLIVFAISFGEFEIAKMVGGFDFRTLPVMLFQSLREDFRTSSAVASILVYVALLGLLGISLLRPGRLIGDATRR